MSPMDRAERYLADGFRELVQRRRHHVFVKALGIVSMVGGFLTLDWIAWRFFHIAALILMFI